MAAREAGSPHSATWRMDHSGRRFAPGRKPHWNANFFSRELGVTYKTAWRMAKEIRTELMEQSEEPLDGTVELDESYFGGKAINMHHAKRERLGGRGTAGKQPVFGMVERQGKVVAVTVDNVSRATLMPHIQERVLPTANIYTDELLTRRGRALYKLRGVLVERCLAR